MREKSGTHLTAPLATREMMPGLTSARKMGEGEGQGRGVKVRLRVRVRARAMLRARARVWVSVRVRAQAHGRPDLDLLTQPEDALEYGAACVSVSDIRHANAELLPFTCCVAAD